MGLHSDLNHWFGYSMKSVGWTYMSQGRMMSNTLRKISQREVWRSLALSCTLQTCIKIFNSHFTKQQRHFKALYTRICHLANWRHQQRSSPSLTLTSKVRGNNLSVSCSCTSSSRSQYWSAQGFQRAYTALLGLRRRLLPALITLTLQNSVWPFSFIFEWGHYFFIIHSSTSFELETGSVWMYAMNLPALLSRCFDSRNNSPSRNFWHLTNVCLTLFLFNYWSNKSHTKFI